jgi:anti-sigma factor RsiW
MNCTRAEQLIPLEVGGDLLPSEADQLRQHIGACAHCRQLAEEFAASQAWLSEFAAPALDPKFDDALFADLRASVLREIRNAEMAEERGRWFERLLPQPPPRFAIVAAVLLLMLAGGLALSAYRHKKPMQEVSIKDRSSKIETAFPTPTPRRELLVEDHLADARAQPKHSRANRHTQRLREVVSDSPEPSELTAQSTPNVEPAVEPTPNTDLAKAEPEMLRIELQTADPNIRIIWFAPKAEKTELNAK